MRCITNNFDIKKHIVMYYLLGCISIFFNCQLLKSSSLIKHEKIHYDDCVKIIDSKIFYKDTIKICEILNHQENFQNFVYNLFYTITFSYVLVREVINDHFFNIKYWLSAHISAIVFSLLGELSIFQFSIDSNTHYNLTKYIILGILGTTLFLLIIRQIYYRKLNFILISKPISIFIIIYLLLLTITNNIKFHFHHSLVAGILSLCFTDFKLKYDLYLHAIFMGIVIQGLNFFSLSEILMFNITDKSPPSLLLLSIIYGIFLGLWILLFGIKIKFCKNNDDIIDDNIVDDPFNFSLIPNEKELELFERL